MNLKTNNFHEIWKILNIIFDEKIIGIIWYDSISLNETNKYDNQIWVFYEHGEEL